MVEGRVPSKTVFIEMMVVFDITGALRHTIPSNVTLIRTSILRIEDCWLKGRNQEVTNDLSESPNERGPEYKADGI